MPYACTRTCGMRIDSAKADRRGRLRASTHTADVRSEDELAAC
jgi:hypothetical protein